MAILSARILGGPGYGSVSSHGVTLWRPENPKNWESEISPRDAVLEIGPERRRFRRDGGREAGGETTRETENLAAWGGESGRGPACGEGDSRASGGRGGRISEFQFFGKRTFEPMALNG
jgi:hypothetical protein